MPRAVTKASATLNKADYELLAEFRYTLRKFLGFSEAVALEHGVTPQQYQVLLAIQGYPGREWVTVGELAEQMQVAHHSAVGIVDRMEALRLVRRTVSREDRRRVEVSLTAKGLAVLEKLYRAHREELQSVGPQLVAILRRAATPPAGGAPETASLAGARALSVSSPSRSKSVRGAKVGVYASPACALPEIDD